MSHRIRDLQATHLESVIANLMAISTAKVVLLNNKPQKGAMSKFRTLGNHLGGQPSAHGAAWEMVLTLALIFCCVFFLFINVENTFICYDDLRR